MRGWKWDVKFVRGVVVGRKVSKGGMGGGKYSV